MTRPIHIDFETYYSDAEKYGIKQMGAHKYVKDPRFDPYLIACCDGSDTWSGHPRNFNWNALEGCSPMAHNAGFDARVYEEMVLRGLAPRIKMEPWLCTANMAAYLCLRRDLKRACEKLLNLDISKDVRDYANGKHWQDMVADGKWDDMLKYGREDVQHGFSLFAKYGHLWPQFERDLSALTIQQAHRGIQIDRPKLYHYMTVAAALLAQTEKALPWIAEGKKAGSTKALAEECRKSNIPPKPIKTHEGEEAVDEWVRQWGAQHAWVRAYANYAKINKLVDTLETIRSRMDDNGIFYFDLLYFGAHTGRWAGSGGYNLQNMRKDAYYIDREGWLISDDLRLSIIEKTHSYGGQYPDFVSEVIDIRSLFIARPGKKMIVSDLSQIEPRVLAWIVNDTVMLESMATGQSPYEAHARATMGWTGGLLKKENKDLYALAKARVLGLGYGCGWKKFIKVASDMAGLDITVGDPEWIQAEDYTGKLLLNKDGTPKMISGYGANSRRIVKDYRASNPLIASKDKDNPGIWRKLDNALRNSEGEDLEFTLPSGRILRYEHVMVEARLVEDEDGKKKVERCYTALAFDQKSNRVVRKPFYGGLLTENVVQAISRDAFAHTMLEQQKDPNIDVLFSVHDEAVDEVSENIGAGDVARYMSKAPEWLKGCPLDAEAKEVLHYCK